MMKYQVEKTTSDNVSTRSLFLVFLFLLQIVVADVEAETLQYIATRLLPNECQSIINHEGGAHEYPSNGIDCFRKLVGWATNLRVNRRDIRLALGNRLRQIGRNDLAELLAPSGFRERSGAGETIEYDSWDAKKEGVRQPMSSSSPSQMDRIFGPVQMKPFPAGFSPEFHHQLPLNPSPDFRRLNGIHGLDSFKDRPLVLANPEPPIPAVPAAPANPPGHPAPPVQGGVPAAANIAAGSNDKNHTVSAPPEIKNHTKPEFPKILSHFSIDEKNATCLRVPLSTALAVIGTIMTLTCCCALLLRNRLAACLDRLRGKKPDSKKSNNKRLSVDEEQGFMPPRTLGKTPKKSGRRGGGPVDVANIGTQNSMTATNGSKESDEVPTGCSNCCSRKKKKNKRKRKK